MVIELNEWFKNKNKKFRVVFPFNPLVIVRACVAGPLKQLKRNKGNNSKNIYFSLAERDSSLLVPQQV